MPHDSNLIQESRELRFGFCPIPPHHFVQRFGEGKRLDCLKAPNVTGNLFNFRVWGVLCFFSSFLEKLLAALYIACNFVCPNGVVSP